MMVQNILESLKEITCCTPFAGEDLNLVQHRIKFHYYVLLLWLINGHTTTYCFASRYTADTCNAAFRDLVIHCTSELRIHVSIDISARRTIRSARNSMVYVRDPKHFQEHCKWPFSNLENSVRSIPPLTLTKS